MRLQSRIESVLTPIYLPLNVTKKSNTKLPYRIQWVFAMRELWHTSLQIIVFPDSLKVSFHHQSFELYGQRLQSGISLAVAYTSWHGWLEHCESFLSFIETNFAELHCYSLLEV